MPATEVEKLAVLIEANTKSYERALTRIEKKTGGAMRRSSKQVNRLSKSMNRASVAAKGLGRSLGIGTVLSGAGFVALAKQSIKAGDSIAKTADKVGLTTTQLQEMRYAAEQTGVATTALDMGMQRFSRRVGEAANGGGELFKILSENNIALRNSDGTMRSQMEILKDYADLIQRAGSKQERLTLAFKAFDSEGAALVNTFSRGSAGVNEFQKRAQSAGVVLREDLVRGAESAHQELTELSKVMQTKMHTAVLEVIPDIKILAGAFSNLIDLFESGARFAARLSVELSGVFAMGEKFADGKFSEGIKAFQTGQQASSELATGLDPFGGMGDPVNKTKPITSRASTVKIPVGGGKSKPTVTAKSILKDLERQIQAVDQHTLSIGKSEGAIVRMTAKQEIWNKLQDSNINLTDAQKETLNSMLDGLEKSTDRFDQVSQKFEGLQDAASVFGDHTMQMFDRLTEGGKFKFKDMVDSMVKDLLRLAVQRSILQPLFGGGASGDAGLFGGLVKGLFGFAGGGFTGNGPAGAVAGVVHGGEYVFSKPATSVLGVRNLDALHSRARGYASGGFVSSSVPASLLPSGSARSGGTSKVMIMLGEGLRAEILDEANQGAVQIVSASSGAIMDGAVGKMKKDIVRGGADGSMARFGIKPRTAAR